MSGESSSSKGKGKPGSDSKGGSTAGTGSVAQAGGSAGVFNEPRANPFPLPYGPFPAPLPRRVGITSAQAAAVAREIEAKEAKGNAERDKTDK